MSWTRCPQKVIGQFVQIESNDHLFGTQTGSFIGTMRRAKLNFTGTSDEVDEQLSKFEKQSFFSKPVQMFGAPMPNPNMTVEVDVVRGQQFYTKGNILLIVSNLI